MNYRRINTMNKITPFYLQYSANTNSTPNNSLCNTNIPVSNIPSDYPRNPNSWGPHLWYYLHNCSANYPINPDTETKNAMINYLLSLGYTIPCNECGSHYKQMINSYKDKLPEICSTRESLFNFIVHLHNKVNERKNKPIMDIENARKMYNYKK